VLRGVWGLVLLFCPQCLLAGFGDRPADRRALVVARILGARQLIQALLSGLRPRPQVLAIGSAVDVAHCLTAGAFAVADRRRARLAVADAAMAAIWAAAGRRDLGRLRRSGCA
jgi:hypothetical protein